MLNKNIFIDICKLSQDDLKEYCWYRLQETHGNVWWNDGYIFAEGTFPVLLVAHLDTVHKETPKTFCYDDATDVLSAEEGIGGDDRCGVFMILEIVKKYNCSVLFCEEEEIGGYGAKAFVDDWNNKFIDLNANYIIEFDRANANDAVFYDCDNKEFTDFICEEFYREAVGTFSDISIIAPATGIAAVNLSCGYYKAHTVSEYVVLPEMQNSIEQASAILERTTGKVFEYVERKYTGNYYSYYDDDWDGYMAFLVEYNDGECDYAFGFSETEAIGDFCTSHPYVPYANIIAITQIDYK